jgi:predicted permease
MKIYHLAALLLVLMGGNSESGKSQQSALKTVFGTLIFAVLRFFSEIKVAELQITDRHFTENGQISKL